MKFHHLSSYLLLLTLFFTGLLSNCTSSEDDSKLNHDLIVTGLTFAGSESGRVNYGPVIANLNIWILDANTKEVVFGEQYSPDDIPDTIKIESLKEGDYEIYAHTAWNDDTDLDDLDAATFPLKVYHYAYTQVYALYADYQLFTLDENSQVEVLQMKNFGSKYNYRLTNTEDLPDTYNLNIHVYADQQTYIFESDDYIQFSTGVEYLNIPRNEGIDFSINHMPTTIEKFVIDYMDSMWEIKLNDPVTIQRGEEITFNFDIASILNSPESSMINFSGLVWIDRGEIIID